MFATIIVLAALITLAAAAGYAFATPDKPGPLHTSHPLHGALGAIVKAGHIEVEK